MQTSTPRSPRRQSGNTESDWIRLSHLSLVVPQLASKNNPACEVKLDSVVEILSIDVFLFEIAFLCVVLLKHKLIVINLHCM